MLPGTIDMSSKCSSSHWKYFQCTGIALCINKQVTRDTVVCRGLKYCLPGIDISQEIMSQAWPSSRYTFLQDLLEILKYLLQNFLKVLNKYLLDTPSIPPHTLSSLTRWRFPNDEPLFLWLGPRYLSTFQPALSRRWRAQWNLRVHQLHRRHQAMHETKKPGPPLLIPETKTQMCLTIYI